MLGETHLAVHHTKLRDITQSIRPAYRILEAVKQPLQDKINWLLAAGIIRECQSDYRAPLSPIRQKIILHISRMIFLS
jgi:hypothetical protein